MLLPVSAGAQFFDGKLKYRNNCTNNRYYVTLHRRYVREISTSATLHRRCTERNTSQKVRNKNPTSAILHRRCTERNTSQKVRKRDSTSAILHRRCTNRILIISTQTLHRRCVNRIMIEPTKKVTGERWIISCWGE
ncbi:hypothetical protein M6B38_112945 [Iris pallida]|uniref:Secreted protein n=1 Tax=Iris pallida TaxID=29817 RepID=A0AAX6IKK1_IRIPA|nr:hypothetical protein M6B38_112945 [Iris pallida]